jgi:hypothetical protein
VFLTISGQQHPVAKLRVLVCFELRPRVCCFNCLFKAFSTDNIFTLDVMEEPVIATDGFTYEKRSESCIPP